MRRLGVQPGLGAHLAVACGRGAVNAGVDRVVLLSNRGRNRTWGQVLLLDEEEAEACARGNRGRSGGLAWFRTPAKGGTEQDQGEAAERAADLGSWDAGEVAVRERRGGRGRKGWCRNSSGLIPSGASATCRQAAMAGKVQEEQRGKERRHGERRRDLVAAAACRRRAGRTGQARGGRGSAGMREEAHGCWWSRHKQRAWAIRRGAAGWLCKTRR